MSGIYDPTKMTKEERAKFAEELTEREDLDVITPTDSFIGIGRYELMGERRGVTGVEKESAVIVMLYDADLDQPVMVVIPAGVGSDFGREIMELDRQLLEMAGGE
jgi:hypothetical protein